MATRDIIVIGTSAGGVEALIRLVSGIDPSFAATLFIVMHFPADTRSMLPDILNRSGKLPAHHAVDGEAIERRRIYVAPPNRHLLVHPGRVQLSLGAQEHGFRPAVDPLFRSAARAYGSRVVGVLLSGNLDDGSAGLVSIRARGGVGVAQDPAESAFSGMPFGAIRSRQADHILSVDEMPALFTRLAEGADVESITSAMPREALREEEGADVHAEPLSAGEGADRPEAISCPSCGGALREAGTPEVPQFACHVGHRFTDDSLVAQHGKSLETALWTAARLLVERAAVARRIAARMAAANQHAAGARFVRRAEDAMRHARLIREELLEGRSSDDMMDFGLYKESLMPGSDESAANQPRHTGEPDIS